MSTAPPSAPPPAPRVPPDPVAATPPSAAGWPAWKPWWAFVALIAAFGAALFGGLIIAGVGAAAGGSLEDPSPAVNIIATVFQDACLIGAAIAFASMAGRVGAAQFGLRATRPGTAVGLVALTYLVFIALSAAWVSLLGLKAEDLPDELGIKESDVALVASAVLVCVVAPIAEELFFRGFFFPALRGWRGTWPAALITGLVFGGIHAGSADVGYLVPLAIFGVLLCLLYVRTRSLYPCIALHCLNNSIAFGVGVDWGWQVPLLFAGAGVLIALLLAATARATGGLPPAVAG